MSWVVVQEGVTEAVVDNYRMPQLVRGWERGMLTVRRSMQLAVKRFSMHFRTPNWHAACTTRRHAPGGAGCTACSGCKALCLWSVARPATWSASPDRRAPTAADSGQDS